jgi:hypothetical protein
MNINQKLNSFINYLLIKMVKIISFVVKNNKLNEKKNLILYLIVETELHYCL